MDELASIQTALRDAAPVLVNAVWAKARNLIPAISPPKRYEEKTVGDLVWGSIELDPLEVAVLDLPLMQRLRRIKQLGLAHLVYPTATHSRLEHSLGTMYVIKRIFDALSEGISEGEKARYRQMVSIAGLLHDSGHVPFSHAGERALKSLLHTHFQLVANVLDDKLQRAVVSRGGVIRIQDKHVKNHPGELLSALFVLSPAFEEFLKSAKGWSSIIAQEDLPRIASLLLNRSVDIVVRVKRGDKDELVSLECLHSVLSGDLDADKLDYIARDTLFTGVPTPADAKRLLVQVMPGRLPKESVEGVTSERIDVFRVYALNQSAVSSFEMFPVSRAYLHDRVYKHHKVRAAEHLLAKQLKAYLKDRASLENPVTPIIDELFTFGLEDDALLLKMPVNDILYRNLPQRAVAISREMIESVDPGLFWSRFLDRMADEGNREQFERDVATASGCDQVLLAMDGSKTPDGVDESADVWVGQSRDDTVEQIGERVNLRQHVTALAGNRQRDWIFCPPEDRAMVAAAAALVMWDQFYLAPNDAAVKTAKLTKSEIDEALTKISGDLRNPYRDKAMQMRGPFTARPLRGFGKDIAKNLPEALGQDEELVGRISREIEGAGLTAGSAKDLRAALQVLEVLLRFSDTLYRKIDLFAADRTVAPERHLSQRLEQALKGEKDLEKLFHPLKEVDSGDGFIDFYFAPKNSELPGVILELKAAESRYETIQKNFVGQVFQYFQTGAGRVGLMLSAFKQKQQLVLADTINVVPNDLGSKLAVISVGLRAADAAASAIGKRPVRSPPSCA